MDENAATTTVQETTQDTTQTVDTAALQAELERLKGENAKLKNAQSNASADAAKYKRALNERMSEQERAETQNKELIEQLKADNAQLKRERTLAKQNAGFVGVGYEADAAEKAATAFYDQDFNGFMAVFKDFLAAHDKSLLADTVRQTPRPGAGGTDKTVTREQFDKMGYSERAKLFNEQPDVYQTLTNRRNE